MKSSKRHVHKYIRAKLGKKTIYKCAIPGCAHYIFSELIEGRFSVCWRCNEPFVITKAQARLKKPHCFDCTNSVKKPQIDRLKNLLDTDDLMKAINE